MWEGELGMLLGMFRIGGRRLTRKQIWEWWKSGEASDVRVGITLGWCIAWPLIWWVTVLIYV
jgi:hypothetical protein